MNESFGLAAFRSRTQVLRMENALHRAGLSAGVIATPREIAVGCGLSVRFVRYAAGLANLPPPESRCAHRLLPRRGLWNAAFDAYASD